MSQLKLEIVTPERAIYSGNADEVTLPGAVGELGVLPGHLPLVTLLKPGEVSASGGGTSRHFAVGSGFAQVLPDRVTVLVSACQGAADIDIENARASLKDLESRMTKDDFKSDAELAQAAEELARVRARITVAERARR